MKKIAVTGGKGGTGKSTVSILLANQFLKEKKKVFLVDCDVECPNDYLLLGQKLKQSQEKILASFPRLDKNKCNQCGLCVKTCRENAIFQVPHQYPVFLKHLCSGCGVCWIVCPQKAISLKQEKVGDIFVNKIRDDFWLITGRADSGVEETGPLVLKTKKFALDLAQKEKIDYLLLDTAPGTHCPVISALLDCDEVFCVTEPTPMGSHDLNSILELCQRLKLPAKVILNQSDLGDKKKILPVIKKFNVKIDKEIPFSQKILRAYLQGRLLEMDLI